jgi:hypothetical protein
MAVLPVRYPQLHPRVQSMSMTAKGKLEVDDDEEEQGGGWRAVRLDFGTCGESCGPALVWRGLNNI